MKRVAGAADKAEMLSLAQRLECVTVQYNNATFTSTLASRRNRQRQQRQQVCESSLRMPIARGEPFNGGILNDFLSVHEITRVGIYFLIISSKQNMNYKKNAWSVASSPRRRYHWPRRAVLAVFGGKAFRVLGFRM